MKYEASSSRHNSAIRWWEPLFVSPRHIYNENTGSTLRRELCDMANAGSPPASCRRRLLHVRTVLRQAFRCKPQAPHGFGFRCLAVAVLDDCHPLSQVCYSCDDAMYGQIRDTTSTDTWFRSWQLTSHVSEATSRKLLRIRSSLQIPVALFSSLSLLAHRVQGLYVGMPWLPLGPVEYDAQQ